VEIVSHRFLVYVGHVHAKLRSRQIIVQKLAELSAFIQDVYLANWTGVVCPACPAFSLQRQDVRWWLTMKDGYSPKHVRYMAQSLVSATTWYDRDPWFFPTCRNGRL